MCAPSMRVGAAAWAGAASLPSESTTRRRTVIVCGLRCRSYLLSWHCAVRSEKHSGATPQELARIVARRCVRISTMQRGAGAVAVDRGIDCVPLYASRSRTECNKESETRGESIDSRHR